MVCIRCEHCLASFPSSGELKQHKITSHSWKCMKCPTLPPFEDGVAWQAHFNAVHAAGARSGTVPKIKERTVPAVQHSKCPECDREFSIGMAMDQHYDAKHRHKTKQNFPCPTCPARFAASSELKIHEENEHTYPCSKCSEIFKTEAAMDQHVDRKHRPPPPPPSLSPHSRQLATESENSGSVKGDDPESSPHNLASGASDKTALGAMNTDQEMVNQNRFYCQEEDCGRGFSTKGFLDTHTKFYHPKKAGNSSSDTTKRETPRGDSPNTKGKNEEANLPVLQTPDRCIVAAGSGAGEGEKDTSTDVATRFRCRICEKLPSTATQPTATSCGHLFCYKCIAPKVTPTSKCPVCHTSISLDRIFRLDIPC